MSGLLKKDFYLMGSMGKSYLLVLGVFGVLTAVGLYQATFLASFLSIMCVMFPINVFAYDEQARWDRYAAALPAGRAGVVRARYLFTLIVGLSAVALVSVIQAAVFFLGKGEDTLADSLFSGIIPAATGILVNAVLLPLLFKFGSQKGRTYMMVGVGVGVGLIFAAATLFGNRGLELTDGLPLLYLLPVLCFLSLIPSYFLSLRIYQQKDL